MATGIPTRDTHIDLWRGLCLVDVVLVHLAFNAIGFPEPLDDVIKHYTRFAAGGFVFLAGLTVAVVFGPAVRASVATRRRAYQRLRRRAAVLVCVDVGAAAALRVLDGARWFPADLEVPLADALWSIALLQRPGLTGGILLLYAVLLTLTPLVFAVRRRLGEGWLLGGSLIAYAVAVAAGEALAWPRYDFPVLFWQPLFIAGFVAERAWAWLRQGGAGRRVCWFAAAWSLFGLVFLAHHGPRFDLSVVATALPLDFRKTPLQPGALLWYLAAIQVVLATSSLCWGALATTRPAAVITLLGRHSLLVYTAHVFTEIPVLEYVWNAWPAAPVRVALAVADLGALVLLCVLVERRLWAHASAWARSWVLVRASPPLRAGET